MAKNFIMSIMIYHRMAEEVRVLSNLKRRCQKTLHFHILRSILEDFGEQNKKAVIG